MTLIAQSSLLALPESMLKSWTRRPTSTKMALAVRTTCFHAGPETQDWFQRSLCVLPAGGILEDGQRLILEDWQRRQRLRRPVVFHDHVHEHPSTSFGHKGSARAAQTEQMDKTKSCRICALTGTVAHVLVFQTLVTYVECTVQFQPHSPQVLVVWKASWSVLHKDAQQVRVLTQTLYVSRLRPLSKTMLDKTIS